MSGLGAVRFNAAISVMQTMVARNEQARGQDNSPAAALPNAIQPQAAETAEASDEFYFGTQMTVTKLMFFMMEKVVGYLNGKLEVGADGNEEAVEAGNRWRKDALKDDIPVGSTDDFRIPEPGENGVTFREVANTIDQRFNMSFLARDRDFTRMLEKLIGFRLPGIDMADIVEAFTDPDSKSAQKLRDVIEDGLAGQEGSKVSQRLERATQGPQSVADLAAKQRSAADVVDAETRKEDREALEAARLQERLGGINDMLDRIGEAVKAQRESDGAADPGDAQGRIDDAMAIIRHLTGMTSADESGNDSDIPLEADKADEAAEADATREADGTDAEATLEKLEGDEASAKADANRLAALADAYSDGADLPGREKDEDEPGFPFAI